jgi:hypothetical protein
MRGSGLIVLIYLVIGVLVAAVKDYFGDVDTLKGIVSALLAVVLWPLVLFGVEFDLGKEGGDGGGGGAKKGSAVLFLLWTQVRARLG